MRSICGLLYLFIFHLGINPCLGQENYIPPKVPAKYVKELEDAVLISQGGRAEEAIKIIESLIHRYPAWTAPRRELSRIYFETGKKQPAIEQLEASLAIDTTSQLNELYTLGRLYEDVSEPNRAWSCYQALIKKGVHQQGLVQRATASMIALENKMELWKNQQDINFTSFDSDINTPQHESLGRWTLDGQKMIFTRLVFDQEDIFFASFDSTAGLWSIEDFTYNSPLNEGAHAISPDGNYLIFTSCNRNDGIGSCDLYLSFKQNNAWTKPTNMGPAFNSAGWDGQPCFGLDGLSLFFSSGRPGGMGGRDIWYVYQMAAGKWSQPINAGSGINTADNEESPFVHFDGQTIYFMRDGKQGLGGYDLYIARKGLNGKWESAENLGAPINGGSDEGALTLHPDGRKAIITRYTEGQKNDLFEFELPEKFKASSLQALHVTVTDLVTQRPVRARLDIFEADKKDTIRLSQWADNDGNISIALRRNTNYGIIASAEGYIMHSSFIPANEEAKRHIEIQMTAVAEAENKVVVLQNIFFETASSALLPSSDPELQKLLWTLRNNPSMKIEIMGHTDDTGDEKRNQTLSEARAQAVYQFLLERGVEAGRLSFKGFGETQPIAENTTPEGRRQNRRTEFRIISN